MKLCAVIECRKDAADHVTMPETNHSWHICSGHKRKVDAGVPWEPLEDRKNILLGQVILWPQTVNWTMEKTPVGLNITITTNQAVPGTPPFVATLTKEQAFQLAATLIS